MFCFFLLKTILTCDQSAGIFFVLFFFQQGGGVNRSAHSTLSLSLSEVMAACQDDSDISSEEYTSDEEFVLPEIKTLKQANEKGDLHTQRERIIKTRKESGSPTLCHSWGFKNPRQICRYSGDFEYFL